MNGKAVVAVFGIVISGYCFAAGPEVVSHEQAAAEALENRDLANDLWLSTFQACVQQDKLSLHKIVQRLSQQSFAQPTNHLNYSARFVYEGCKQLLSDVWAFNGMCLSKSASKEEIVRVSSSWEKNSGRCDIEISSPDLSRAEHPKEQSEAEWEAEQRRNGESEEDIALMKQIRNS
jgi:hypothetical protein